jgi:hypothetical protein
LASRDTFDREYRAIIAMLQSHRRRAGMTQWGLGPRRGTDQSQISKLERSERRLESWIICGFAARSALIREAVALVDFWRTVRK